MTNHPFLSLLSFLMFLLLLFILATRNVVVSIKNKKLQSMLEQSIVDNSILKGISNNLVLDKNEEFLNFISQSRDDAFKYIEDVQSGLNIFVKEMKDEVAYFERFGILTEQYPNHDIVQKFVKHYHDLKSLLPEEKDD